LVDWDLVDWDLVDWDLVDWGLTKLNEIDPIDWLPERR
jgi:hypothetical protein